MPSKTFIGVAAPLSIGFAVTFYLLYLQLNSGALEASAGTANALQIIATDSLIAERFGNLDSDGDGLQDWEENLWGSDIYNQDTDGDGLFDNDEVTAGRDPTIPAPDDLIDGTRNAFASSTDTGTRTETEQLAVAFFSSYLQLKQTGQFNESNKQQLVAHTINNAVADFELKQFSDEDFDTIPSDEITRLAYYRQMEQLLLPLNAVEEYDIGLAYEAHLTKSERALEQLKTNLTLYTEIIDGLKNMSVPEDALPAHKKVANTMLQYHQVLESMSTPEADPVAVLMGIQIYPAIEQSAAVAREALQDYLLGHGIEPYTQP